MDAAACRLDPTLHGHSLRCGVVRCDKHCVYVACYPQQSHSNGCCQNDASKLVRPNRNAPLSKSCSILPNLGHPCFFFFSVSNSQFFCLHSSSVHTNPSRKRSFSNRSSNRRNLKTLALRFSVDGIHFGNGVSENGNHVISLPDFFFKHKSKMTGN